MAIRSITGAKTLAIRLSKAESATLTRVRARQELKTEERCAIKVLISYLIDWADKEHAAGLLNLPVSKDVPLLDADNTYERIAYVTSEEDRAALARISVNPNGRELHYGEADIVRQIIKISESKLFGNRV